MSCDSTVDSTIDNRKTDPGTYFNDHFGNNYKLSCGAQQIGSLNDVAD